MSWEVQIPIDVVKSMDALLSLTTDSKSRLCTFGVQSLLRTCVHFIAPKDTIHEASHGRSQVSMITRRYLENDCPPLLRCMKSVLQLPGQPKQLAIYSLRSQNQGIRITDVREVGHILFRHLRRKKDKTWATPAPREVRALSPKREQHQDRHRNPPNSLLRSDPDVIPMTRAGN